MRMTIMIRVGLLLLIGAVLNTNLQAQEMTFPEANYDLAERFTTQKMEKMVGSIAVNPNWIEDEERFWYSFETPEGKNWYLVNAPQKTKNPLFDQEDMAARLAESLKKPFNSKDLPLKEFKYDIGKSLFTFHVDSIRFSYSASTGELVRGDSIQKEPDEAWITYSPDSTWISFARNHNLFVMRADDPDSVEIQLTEDGERWYSYQAQDGDTTTTKRLRSRAQWFEDEEKLYVRRQDRRKMGDLWVINALKERPELETYKYAMPGEEHVPIDELVIVDVESREATTLKTDKWKDQALGGTYFNKGGIYTTETSDYLYFLRRDRTWKKIDVCRGNTTTGEVEVLWSEESNPYFNTRFAELAILNEGEEFLWWSERNGWGQLYRYNSDGELINKITDGFFVVGDVERIDTTGQVIYFEGFGKEEGVNPYYSLKYRVNFDGSGLQRLTPEPANHSFSMSDPGGYFVDTYSTVHDAPVSVLRDTRGNVVMELERVDLGAMEEAGWQMPETFTVKAADGATDLYGVMWKPFDFDPEKKYPIITYVYPGPQTEPFPIGFTIAGSRGRPIALAQLGFVVVAFGQRGGSPLRSKYYHNYGYGNLRDYPLADNKYGLEQLGARHSFIDLDRVGIFGHSGGGFMSTAALLTYPEFYDVAVSSAGNHDNNIYNMWWSEVHDGVEEKKRTAKKDEKQEASEGQVNGEGDEEEEVYFESYIETNIELAENLQGDLLLVHGDIDSNVHPANTIRLANALIEAGKRFDFMIMPGKRHGFGDYTPYFERMMWDYFAEHLLGHARTTIDFNIPDEEN